MINATQRLPVKRQTLDEAYAPPANFLEIEVTNHITHGVGKARYTDYEVRMKTNLPVFKLKESSVRRRYSDFEWLRNELERDSKVTIRFYRVAGHPLAQNEKCLHMFLQDAVIDKNYVPGKIRST
uniref:Sorting nexin-3 n=1 Tax=Romanomermis culicivorax TaxID=13658 RepID=A0A915IAR8_ROMCU